MYKSKTVFFLVNHFPAELFFYIVEKCHAIFFSLLKCMIIFGDADGAAGGCKGVGSDYPITDVKEVSKLLTALVIFLFASDTRACFGKA